MSRSVRKRGRPFQPGNTFGRGRPRGSRNKKSLMLQRLLLEQAKEIVQSVIDRAKEGDRTAQALCMERLIPRLKDVPEPVEQPQEDPPSNTNEHTHELDLSGLSDESSPSSSDSSSASHRVTNTEIWESLDAEKRRRSRRKIDRYYPETGPLRRELYRKHLSFFPQGLVCTRAAVDGRQRLRQDHGRGA